MPEKKESRSGFSPASQMAGWIRQGIGSFMAAQKILLDLTAQQNALVIGMLRERLSDFPRPDVAIAKIADSGVQNITAAGKVLLDLVGDDTKVVADGMKEVMPIPGAGSAANLLRHRLSTLLDMQKHFLEAAAHQTHEAVESYQEGKGLMAVGSSVAELAKESIENLIETEKKFLELATHEVSAGTKGGVERKATRERYKVLTEMAREAGENYVEAQKKLLNLAIEQMESAGKTVGHRLESVGHEARTSWGELTDKSAKNFATAKNSLMDLVAKPSKSKEAATTERKRKAPHARPKASKAAAEVNEAA